MEANEIRPGTRNGGPRVPSPGAQSSTALRVESLSARAEAAYGGGTCCWLQASRWRVRTSSSDWAGCTLRYKPRWDSARGYATEIGRFGLDHAFSILGVEEVVAFTEVHNVRSRVVMERLGMRYVGRILRPGLIAGSAGVHEAAPFALYRITRPAHDPS